MSECVAVFKDCMCSVRRHHIEKHPTVRSNFPEGSQERAVKMQFACILQLDLCYYDADMHSPREIYSSSPLCVMDLGKIMISAIKNVPLSDT